LAKLALSTGPAEPRNSNAIPNAKSSDPFTNRFDSPDNFVSENQGQFRLRQFAVDNMQIGSTNGACGNADEKLARCRTRRVHVAQDKRRPNLFQQHRAHAAP
jgi:hypothetical protein